MSLPGMLNLNVNGNVPFVGVLNTGHINTMKNIFDTFPHHSFEGTLLTALIELSHRTTVVR